MTPTPPRVATVYINRLPEKLRAVDHPAGYLHAYYLFKTNQPRTRATRVVFTTAHLKYTMLRTEWHLWADNGWLGKYTIVGIAHFDTGYAVGEIPGLKLAAATA